MTHEAIDGIRFADRGNLSALLIVWPMIDA